MAETLTIIIIDKFKLLKNLQFGDGGSQWFSYPSVDTTSIETNNYASVPNKWRSST